MKLHLLLSSPEAEGCRNCSKFTDSGRADERRRFPLERRNTSSSAGVHVPAESRGLHELVFGLEGS